MPGRLIYTISIGEEYREISKFTHPTLRAYAKRCGADFLSIERVRSPRPPHFLKFLAVRLLLKYDRVVFLDSDVVVKASCPDLFEVVPEGCFGLVDEQRYGRDWRGEAPGLCKRFGVDWNGRTYNAGVMVFDRSHRNFFRECVRITKRLGVEAGRPYFDQPCINAMIARFGVKVHELDWRFNWLCFFGGIPPKKEEAFIVHGAVTDKRKFLEEEARKSGWPQEVAV